MIESTHIQLDDGTWKVRFNGNHVSIVDPQDRQRHSSIGHESTAIHLAMALSRLRFESNEIVDRHLRHAAEHFCNLLKPGSRADVLSRSGWQDRIATAERMWEHDRCNAMTDAINRRFLEAEHPRTSKGRWRRVNPHSFMDDHDAWFEFEAVQEFHDYDPDKRRIFGL